MIVAMFVVGYILSVIIGWFGGRYMEIDNAKYGGKPLPCFIAILFTFVPPLNLIVGGVALVVFFANKSQIFNSRKFYRLDR